MMKLLLTIQEALWPSPPQPTIGEYEYPDSIRPRLAEFDGIFECTDCRATFVGLCKTVTNAHDMGQSTFFGPPFCTNCHRDQITLVQACALEPMTA